MARRVTRVVLEGQITGLVRSTRQGGKEIDGLRDKAQRFSRGRYEAQVGVDAAKAHGEMSALEKRLQAYARESPEARVNLDTDEARARLAAVQARLTAFGREVATADVDVNDADARAKLSRIEAALLTIGSRTAKPDIDLAGVAKAEADLGMLESRLRSFDGKDYTAHLNLRGSAEMQRSAALILDALLILGPAAVASAGAAGAALVALGGSATFALGAIAPVALAFSGMGDALKALGEQEKAAAQNAEEHARAQVMAARSIADARRGLASAERDVARNIADARRAVADAERQAAQQVSDARRAVAETEQQVNREIADARQAVADAERDAARQVADARRDLNRTIEDTAVAHEQAADRIEDAERDVVDAEREVAEAHRDVKDALDELHEARQQAIRDLQDLREQESDNALDIESAKIALARAREELARVQQDETASALDLREAKLGVREAEDRLSDARREGQRDHEDLIEAEKKGIKNADGVVEARDRVKQAQESLRDTLRRVQDAREALSDAEREANRVDRESAEAIADARRQLARAITDGDRNIADARRNLVRTITDGDQSMADARRVLTRALKDGDITVAEARRTLAQAVKDGHLTVAEANRTLRRAVQDANYTLGQQTAEAQKLREAMGELTPAGREFARFLFEDLKPKLEKLQAIAQKGLLPGVQDGLTSLMDEMPRFERIVNNYSKALGQLAREGGDALNDPFWKNYFDFIGNEAHGSIMRMGRALGNFIEGLAGIHRAFFPLQKDVEEGILGWSRSFSEWGKQLRHTKRFQDFLEWAQRVGPKAMDALGAVADALLAIAVAAAPVGEFTLPVIKALARVIEQIAKSDAGTPLIAIAVGLATVNRALTITKAIAASNVVSLFTGIGTQGKHAASGMISAKTAARGLAGAAGLGLLLHSTTQTNEALGTMESVIGGALAGAAIGGGAGPWGAGIGATAGALGGLALSLTNSGEAAEEAKPEVQEYVQTLNQLTSATTRATRATVAKRLEDAGILELAQKAGIPLANVVDAVIRGGRAYERFGEALEDAAEAGRISRAEHFKLVGAISDEKDALDAARGSNARLTEAVGNSFKSVRGLTDAFFTNKNRADALSKAIREAERRFKAVTGEARLSETQVYNLGRQFGLNREAAQKLAFEYSKLTDRTRAGTDASKAYDRAIRDVANQLGLNRKDTNDLTDAIRRKENAVHDLTGKYKLNKEQLKDVAERMGLTRKQTQELIEKYNKVPENIRTKAHFDDDQARRETENFVEWTKNKWEKLKTVSPGFFGDDTVHIPGGQFAAGGFVSGPGTATSDSIPARLSDGEFVQRASAVQREGVPAMRALNEGRATIIPAFADGGPVGGGPSLGLKADFPRVRVVADFADLKEHLNNATEAIKATLLTPSGWGPGSGDRVQYSGVTLDRYTLIRLKAAESLINRKFDLTQGSFSTSVAASGGTHDGGGAFDADSPFTRAAVVALRKAGIAAWRRYPYQGPWGTHIHGIALGDKLASPAAKQQMQDYQNGGDGLGGKDYEPRPGIQPGLIGGPGGGMNGKSAKAAKAYAKSLFGKYHWDIGNQFPSLNKLWERESNWNYKAINPSSGAGGIPQALPPSKMGPGWQNDPAQQIRWGLGYIHDRYRTPVKAWGHSQSVGWYDRGGPFYNNTVGVNTSGGTEEVLTPTERSAFVELGKWASMSRVQFARTAGDGASVEGLLQRIADATEAAMERGDAQVVLDTGVLAGEVTRRQQANARGQRVAAGTAGWSG